MAGPEGAEDFLEEELLVAGEIKDSKAVRPIPSWLKGFLDQEGALKVQHEVEKAELETQAEIVPMIVRSSSTKGFLPFHIFLILALVGLLFLRDWPHHGIFWFLGLSFFLAPQLARWPWLQRLLIPKEDQVQDVFHRAHFEFYEKNLSHTQQSLGVLIFVSLSEHRCVILADRNVSEKIDDQVWNEALQVLLDGIKQKDATKGFSEAIRLCSQILKKHFPAQSRNPNELANQLIIED